MLIEVTTTDGHKAWVEAEALVDAAGNPLSLSASSTAPWNGQALSMSGYDEAQLDIVITSGNVAVEISADGSSNWRPASGINLTTLATQASPVTTSGLYSFPASASIRATPSGTAVLNLLRR